MSWMEFFFEINKHLETFISDSKVNAIKTVLSAKSETWLQKLWTFIGYIDNDVFRPSFIILPQMSGFIKYFDNVGKSMPFMIQDDSTLVKYKDIWDKIKELIG